MSEEPRFPAPEEAKRRETAASSVPTQPARAVVVSRPDPIPDSVGDAASDGKKGAPKLTPDEVRALLAVEGVNRPRGARAMWKRGRVILIPVTVIDLATHFIFGAAAPWVMSGLTIVALVWCAAPLFKRDEWG